MSQPPIKPKPIIDTLGEEIIRIITPVSLCMLLVVLLVTTLLSSSSNSSSFNTIATIAYTENTTDSIWDKLKGALLNSLIFVFVVTVTTFILVALFYFKCNKFLKLYMGFSSCIVLGFMGGEVALFILKRFNVGLDCFTFCICLFNFTLVGGMSVFSGKMAILVTQGYSVVIGMLVAFWFTMLPEWTTWGLLVSMALYDLAAVLLPGGPLKLLVELAMERNEEIPALVYEVRPVGYDQGLHGDNGLQVQERRLWRNRNTDRVSEHSSENDNSMASVIHVDEMRVVISEEIFELSVPLIDHEV